MNILEIENSLVATTKDCLGPFTDFDSTNSRVDAYVSYAPWTGEPLQSSNEVGNRVMLMGSLIKPALVFGALKLLEQRDLGYLGRALQANSNHLSWNRIRMGNFLRFRYPTIFLRMKLNRIFGAEVYPDLWSILNKSSNLATTHLREIGIQKYPDFINRLNAVINENYKVKVLLRGATIPNLASNLGIDSRSELVAFGNIGRMSDVLSLNDRVILEICSAQMHQSLPPILFRSLVNPVGASQSNAHDIRELKIFPSSYSVMSKWGHFSIQTGEYKNHVQTSFGSFGNINGWRFGYAVNCHYPLLANLNGVDINKAVESTRLFYRIANSISPFLLDRSMN